MDSQRETSVGQIQNEKHQLLDVQLLTDDPSGAADSVGICIAEWEDHLWLEKRSVYISIEMLPRVIALLQKAHRFHSSTQSKLA